jgi:hypothetical protein
MKTKPIPAARLELVADKNGDILWEPRKVPLMRDTLGISQRAELARQAMAAPIDHSPCPPPASPLAVFNDLAAMPGWAKWIFIGSYVLLVLTGIGMLLWAST